MKFVFDPTKNASNLRKHGVSLDAAERIEWDKMWAFEDVFGAYGEVRMIGFGYIGLQLYCVVFTDLNDETRRIISLRKATKQEIKRYAEA